VVIVVPTLGARFAFGVMVVDALPDLHIWPDGTVCFPLHVHEVAGGPIGAPSLFDQPSGETGRHNVTDHALAVFQALDPAIGKDDVFHYVYGILHSPDYRTAFAGDLKKSLPRIPLVATSGDFSAFAEAGRELVELHLGYETIKPWEGLTYSYAPDFDETHPNAYRVLTMKHPKVVDPATGDKVDDRTRIVYNEWITVENIPLQAYDYELGPRSALGWVLDAWKVRTDKPSEIRNDPNAWAIEHDEPTYILDLIGRVVSVSMRTLAIVERLPRLQL
jgi:predicted helicase